MSHSLYRGAVYHQRLQPVDHAFHYPVFFTALDVDELDEANKLRLFGHNRRALFSLRDADYLDRPEEPLAVKCRRFLESPDMVHIVTVTVPRVLGYVFNPVSFHLGYNRERRLVAMLAEVNNTFQERHVYALRDPEPGPDGSLLFQSAKAFHVSPFNDRQGTYLFRVKESEAGLEVHIDIQRDGQIVFHSGLIGRTRVPLTDAALLKTAAAFPFQNLLTIARIHFQAAKLYFGKKMPYFPKPGPESAMTIKIAPPTALEKIGIRIFIRLLKNIQTGRLTLIAPDGQRQEFGREDGGPAATLHIKDYTFYRRILLDGDIGLGEAFMYGQWDSPDVTAFISLLIANRDVLQNGELASSRLKWLLHRVGHLFRSNTKRGSRQNISAHYDLSNDFFALFLDPTMMYSSGYFRSPVESLEQSQHHKMQMLMEKADIRPEHHVLEIGSGWGGMAIEMAKTTGCRVTSVTISRAQLSFARERVKAAGLEDRVTIEFCDYRDLKGSYDRVVSIEMLEAVGHEHFDAFFQTIDRVLTPEGRAVLQTITMPHDRYDAYRKSVDWIQKHIFPGGHLPSVEALKESMARCSRLMIHHMDDIGAHYAVTLKLWREQFDAHRDRISAMGYDDVFKRTWQYYFCYCEAAFATKALGNYHLVITRPSPMARTLCRS